MARGWPWVVWIGAVGCAQPPEADAEGSLSTPDGAVDPAPGRCVYGEDTIVTLDQWLEPFVAFAGDAIGPAVGDFEGTLDAAGVVVPLHLSLDIGQAELHLQDAWWEGPWPAADPVACAPTLRVAVAADVDADSWLQTQFVGELVLLPSTTVLASEVPGAAVAGAGASGDAEVAWGVAAVRDPEGWSGTISRLASKEEPVVLAEFWTRPVEGDR
jgi:hypothetical protein